MVIHLNFPLMQLHNRQAQTTRLGFLMPAAINLIKAFKQMG